MPPIPSSASAVSLAWDWRMASSASCASKLLCGDALSCSLTSANERVGPAASSLVNVHAASGEASVLSQRLPQPER